MEAWVELAVALLSRHWSGSYKITYADGCFQAERRGDNHDVLLDETPEGLLRLIQIDRSL
jgi:hypothetical protein